MTQKLYKSERPLTSQSAVEEAFTQELERREPRRQAVHRLRLLWEQRGRLSRFGAVGFLASTVLAFLIPARFTSTTRLMPPDSQSASSLAMTIAAMSGRAGGLGGVASEVLGLRSTSDILVGMLISRTAKDKLILQFDLKKGYGGMEDARQNLADHTNISVDRKSQIITLSVTDHNPRRAAAMAQAYVEELNHLVVDLNTSSARREREFLEERLKSVSQDLESAEKDFSEFASKNTAIDIKEQGRAMVEAAATLQGQLIAAQSELEGLKQIYTDSNVRVRSVRARIDELQRQLEKLGGKGEVTQGRQEGDSLYPSIRKLPLLGVTFADLYRRTKVQESVYEALTQEYELAKVQEAKEIPSVKVLDRPDVPEEKTFPPRRLIMFSGTCLALCFAVLYVFGSEVWKGIDPRDPGKVLAREIWIHVKERRYWKNGQSSRNSIESEGRRHSFLRKLLGGRIR